MKRYFKIFAIFITAYFIFGPLSVFAADLSPGELVKASGPAVYLVAPGGKRMAFPNADVYFSWYPDFSGVKIISDAELAALTLSSLVTVRPGNMIKLVSDTKVYAVAHDGVLRYLSAQDIAAAIFGADWNKKIILVADAFAASYAYGDQITSAAQYSRTDEAAKSPDILTDKNLSTGETPANPATQTPVVAAPPVTQPVAASGAADKNILFILFDPQRPTNPTFDSSVFKRVVYGAAPSVADYYDLESDHKAHLVNAGILGWYTGKASADKYFSDAPADHLTDGFTTGTALRTNEAVKDADKDFDFSKYDLNHDHKIMPSELSVIVVIPQQGAPADDTADLFAAQTPEPLPFDADGETVWGVGEIFVGSPLGEKAEFGTIAHCLAKYTFGIQDMAPTPSDKFSVGAFSLMSNPKSDLLLDPQSRIFAGWLTPVVIPDDMDVTDQQLAAIGGTDRVIKINRTQPLGPGPYSEYFLIENREPGVYDTMLPDRGLAVWDVFYNMTTKLIRYNPTTPVVDSQALWYKRIGIFPVNFNEFHWADDGARSGVSFANVGDPGQNITFTLNKKILTEYDLRPNLYPQ